MHPGGLSNTEKRRKKNPVMMQRSSRRKTAEMKGTRRQAVGKTQLKHDKKKRRRL